MSLLPQQLEFTKHLQKLFWYAESKGYGLTLADGSIDQKRKYLTSAGSITFGTDAVHRNHPPSAHYSRRAQDLNLFVKVDNVWVWRDSDCPEWRDLGKFWEGLHPFCRWGGRFASVDLNHFSFTSDPSEA